ncbi:MAG: YeeE/YedE thiosulfate transporter family protein [Pseudomonadota bacterium]
MLFELYDWGVSAQTLQLLFALGLGLIFGAAAQISRFCLRRAVIGERAAGAVWLLALGVAVAGFAAASQAGYLALEGHRYLSTDIPVVAIVLGGLAFGAGMVLTRGCVSRLTVLSAGGNLRAVTVLAVFAIVAHAMLKGVFAPLRVALGSVTLDSPVGSLGQVAGAAPVIAVLLIAAALYLARVSGARARDMVAGAVIGAVIVGAWATTSVLLMDEFEPLPVQGAAFTLPWTDTLFWTLASTAIPAGFGVGFIGGVLGGAFLAAALRGELALQSFDSPAQTLRYGAGGAMMGFGGVLAGGCTVGAGLSGGAALSVSALLALGAIIVGGVVMNAVLNPRGAAQPV